MERRRLVAKWCIQQGFIGWENIGELAAAPLIAALATFSGCPNHLRSLKQNMAYRRHTHSLHCCNPNISGCL